MLRTDYRVCTDMRAQRCRCMALYSPEVTIHKHSPILRSAHTVYLCFVCIWEQTAIISLYNINWLVFITETECVYCAVRTGSLYIILRSANTVYLCVLCGSENKQRLFPYTPITGWFLQPRRSVYCAVRSDLLHIIQTTSQLQKVYTWKGQNTGTAAMCTNNRMMSTDYLPEGCKCNCLLPSFPHGSQFDQLLSHHVWYPQLRHRGENGATVEWWF